MGQVFYILAGAALTMMGSYALGRMAWQRAGVAMTRQEEAVYPLILGSGLYSLLIYALGVLHLYYKPVFVALPLVLLAAAWRLGALRRPEERLAALPVWLRRAAWVIGIPFGFLYLANAIAPEASADGSTYHLGLVARFYRERGMVPVTTTLYAALSQGMEMLFVASYAIGRHSAAALTHCAFLFALPWAMWCWARRLGQPVAGAVAAVLVYCSPVVGNDGISAYNDVAGAAVLFALFALLDRWEATREAGLLPLVGVLAGYSYGIKYTLALSLPFALVWVFWRSRAWRPLAAVALPAAAMILPWVIRNVIWWHNPVAPLFNRFFPNPYIHQWFEMEYKQHMARYDLTSLTAIPWEITWRGEHLAGLLGPLFLAAPLALLALARPEGRRLLLAWLVFSATYFTNIGTRFLIPGLPFLTLALALVLVRWRPAALAFGLAHAVLSWPDVVPVYAHPYAWRIAKAPWREALRLIPEDKFLADRLPSYSLVRMIDPLVPAGRRIFGMQQIAEAYTAREYLVGFQSAEGELYMHTLLNGIHADRQPSVQVVFRFPARAVERLRITAPPASQPSRWSVHEVRFHEGTRELERSPFWRLQASSTPEQIPLAFDNNPATRWQSDTLRTRDMGLTVDFGTPTRIDRVILEMSPDQALEGFALEGIPEAVIDIRHGAPPRGLRRAAAEELLARGIGYIIVFPDDFWIKDIRERPFAWGFEELAARGGLRLFRIQTPSEYQASQPAK